MDADRLAKLAVKLGADVPVFVRGLAAWAEGVGERLVPLTLEQPWYVLILFPFPVSTAAVFHAPALTTKYPQNQNEPSAWRRIRCAEIAGGRPTPDRRHSQ